MNDIELNQDNIPYVCYQILKDVKPCSNRERQTTSSEMYLRCGGGYDTESTTITDSSGKPLYAFVYHVQIMINGTYMYFRDIELIVPFFEELIKQVRKKKVKKKQPKLIIWVANLAHEFAFFKRQLEAVGISDLFAKTERTPLKIVLQDCIELRECIGLYGSSLADIAKKHTNTQKLKGDLDYKLIRTPKTHIRRLPYEGKDHSEYEYMKNDVKILDELSEVAFKQFTDNKLKIPMTATGILRQKCKNSINRITCEYYDNMLLMPATEKEYTLMRKYMYCGGLSGTSPIYAGKMITGSKCADIVSDYPAQINHHKFPAGELRETKPENITKVKNRFHIVLFSCDIYAKTKHAVLSRHKVINSDRIRDAIVINGKIWTAKNCILCLNNTDIQGIKKLYIFKNIRVLKLWYFTDKKLAPRFLRKCMNEDYMQKVEIKSQISQLEKEIEKEETPEKLLKLKELKKIYGIVKSYVNSYYGMTATRLYDCIYKWSPKKHDITQAASDLSYDERRRKMWLSPYIAYWTTSYARGILYHYIAKYPELILQYDTDSLYYITEPSEVRMSRDRDCTAAELIAAFEADLREYNKTIYAKNKRIFNGDTHFSDLGSWEIDSEVSTGFKGLGAKRYLVRHAAGDLKPTVAGMVSESFLQYVGYDENTKQCSIDPFDIFDSDLKLDRIKSQKTASKYNDKQLRPVKITDYEGNTCIVPIGTYHAIYDISFDIKTADLFLKVSQLYQEESALPYNERTAEPLIKKFRELEAQRRRKLIG